jgi:hypothetical protein
MATIAAWRWCRSPTPTRWPPWAERCPGPYATYNLDGPSRLAREQWAASDHGALIGYCCLGEPARVGNAAARADTLAIGYGLAPELMGRGTGRRFVVTSCAAFGC